MNSASITGFASNIIFVPMTSLDVFAESGRGRSGAHARVACALARWVTSPAYTIPCAWPRRSQLSIRCSAAAWQWRASGIMGRSILRPFGPRLSSPQSPTLEFVDYMRAAFGDTQPFSFHGTDFHTESAEVSVQPFQRPRIRRYGRRAVTRKRLSFARVMPSTPAISYPSSFGCCARYRKFLEDWNKAGWPQKPNIAYCTIVHVDETDEKAIKTGLFRASRAYDLLRRHRTRGDLR